MCDTLWVVGRVDGVPQYVVCRGRNELQFVRKMWYNIGATKNGGMAPFIDLSGCRPINPWVSNEQKIVPKEWLLTRGR